jgi:hypothetical protein
VTVTRTRKEIRDLAEALVYGMIGEVLQAFPKIRKAVDKVPSKEWLAALDQNIDTVEEALLNKFDSRD